MRWTFAAAVLLALVGQPATAGRAITEKQLIELVEKGIDLDIVIRLVERDCVAFDIDAGAVLKLSEAVPAPVLHAAMDCRERADLTGAAEESPAVSHPPSAAVPAASSAAGLSASSAAAPAVPPAPPDFPAPPGASKTELSAGKPFALNQVGKIAIVAFVQDGKYHQALTDSFRKQLTKRGIRFDLEDLPELAVPFDATADLHSSAPAEAVLAAGRSAGVQAVILGVASTYSVREYPSIAMRLSAKLVEVNRGEVLWSAEAASEEAGSHHSWHDARKAVVRAVVKEFP